MNELNNTNRYAGSVACEMCGKQVSFEHAKASHVGMLCSDCFEALGLSDEAYLSRKQASKLLGVSEPTMSRMLMRGDVPAYRIGLRWRIPLASVLARIESNK